MKIINAGNRIMNTWVYKIDGGYVMIDTGYPNKLKNVEKKLRSNGITWNDIRYVFLTHAHDDHAGFLNELLHKCSGIKVILNPESIPGLRRGQNSFKGGCSTAGAYLFCRCMELWGRGKHLFPSLEKQFDDRLILINGINIKMIEEKLCGKILFTPGHTDDSISLKVNNLIFCGDAAMDGFPSSHHITIWVEEKESFEASWETLLTENAEILYPAHGKPFETRELIKNKSFISKVKLRTLV